MNFLIPKDKFPGAPGKVSSCPIPSFSPAHTLRLPAGGPLSVHLNLSIIPNTCVKRSRSRMRP